VLRYCFDTRGLRTGVLLASRPAGATRSSFRQLQQTEYVFDVNGRLNEILDNGVSAVKYEYDVKGQVCRKLFGCRLAATIGYDDLGRLARMEFSGGALSQPVTLAYEWDAAGQLTRRTWNGMAQRYVYDAAGQLRRVLDDATDAEREDYRYDHAGNMIEKRINGLLTQMTYNKANQIASIETPDGVQRLRYDNAGRLLGAAGGPVNSYGWLDRVICLARPDGSRMRYEYWPNGQLAAKIPEKYVAPASGGSAKPEVERFLWDGLALLRRNDVVYVIEPHASGGVPIASHPAGQAGPVTWYLNDLLGTTLATIEGEKLHITPLTAFGQPSKLKPKAEQPLELKPDVPSTPLPKK